MTANEMIVVARLADHYENDGVGVKDGHDPLDVATHDFRKFKKDAPQLWRSLRESARSDRSIGDWLYDFFTRYSQSGMSLKNFAADELDQLGSSSALDAPRGRRRRG